MNRIVFAVVVSSTLVACSSATGDLEGARDSAPSNEEGGGADGGAAVVTDAGRAEDTSAPEAPVAIVDSATAPETAPAEDSDARPPLDAGAEVLDSKSEGPVGQDPKLYERTFTEEFDHGYDPSVWNDHVWYLAPNPTKNYAVESGVLKIWPQKDASGKFFDRVIDTDGHYYQTHGFFEMSAKLCRGKGTWPAFWLYNHDDATLRPEIDIMEAYPGGDPWGADGPGGVRLPVMYGATIWIGDGARGGFKMIPTPDLSAAFHVYGLKWEGGKQTFYFDGKEVYSATVSMGGRMYILLDILFGSASGTPDDSTPTGKANSYEIDYVRAWRLK